MISQKLELHLSLFHSIIVTLLSILYTVNISYPEVILGVSLAYFLLDLVVIVSLGTKDRNFVWHHVLALGFVYYGWTEPYRTYYCRGIIVELSTIFLNFYRFEKTKFRGVMFLISFVLMRIIYIPWFYWTVLIPDFFVIAFPLHLLVLLIYIIQLIWLKDIIGMITRPKKILSPIDLIPIKKELFY